MRPAPPASRPFSLADLPLRPLRVDGCSASIFGRRKANIESAAAELSRATGKKCIGVSGDVRKLESLQDAVKRTVDEFGRIDFVIAGALPRQWFVCDVTDG